MKRVYVVLGVDDDRIVYAGDNEYYTATALEPGHTFGYGRTETAAMQMALGNAKAARWAYGELGLGPRQPFSSVSNLRKIRLVPDQGERGSC